MFPQAFEHIGADPSSEMGSYYGERILWRCVDIDENGPLMLSDKILCLKQMCIRDRKDSSSGCGRKSLPRQPKG